MRIRRERYFSIHSKHRPGELARITVALMEASVDCSGIWGFSTNSDNAEIIVVPRNPSSFKELSAAESWNYSEGFCFHLEGQDKTGALVEILKRLSSDGVNVRATDAIAVENKFGCYIWVSDEDQEHVAQLLGLSTPKP